MNKEIDLKNYVIRTDLAIEAIDGIEYQKENINYQKTKVTRFFIDKETGKKINKQEGNYVTIEFEDVTDIDNKKELEKALVTELKRILKLNSLTSDKTCLIVGLGNDKSTPDSLGPLVVNKVLVTAPLFEINEVSEGFSNTLAFEPKVMARTGIETSDLISSIVKKFKPDYLIVIDALASKSVERLNKTIQISDTGISPGSGVGNKRKEISINTINVPVIALGIPTVVDAVTIVSDTINYMQKKYSYTKNNLDTSSYKLGGFSSNYLNKEKENIEDRKKLFGLIGNLDEDEIRQLLYEVLTPIGYNLMVTVKEVDFIMEKLSDVIAYSINKSLHKSYKI